MATINIDGAERSIRYRRVPGFFNASTYHVDIDGEHVMTVYRSSSATWDRSATWVAYRPGVDWGAVGPGAAQARTEFRIAYGTSRALAVKHALRKTEAEAQS